MTNGHPIMTTTHDPMPRPDWGEMNEVLDAAAAAFKDGFEQAVTELTPTGVDAAAMQRAIGIALTYYDTAATERDELRAEVRRLRGLLDTEMSDATRHLATARRAARLLESKELEIARLEHQVAKNRTRRWWQRPTREVTA